MVGSELKKLRLSYGLNVADAAKLINITGRSWYRYERGDRQISAAHLELFCLKAERERVSSL